MKRFITALLTITMLVLLTANTSANEAYTTADALTVLRASAGLIHLTSEQAVRFDLNGDGVINSADALIILRIAAGLSEAPPQVSAPVVLLPFEDYLIQELRAYSMGIDVHDYIGEVWASEEQREDFLDRTWDIRYDVPLLYHFNRFVYLDFVDDRRTLIPSYIMTESEYRQSQALYEAAVERALAVVQPNMTKYEAAKALHDYLVFNVDYDLVYLRRTITEDNPRGLQDTSYGALVNKLAVCEGDTLAYIELLSRVGIECIYISTVAAMPGSNLGHAWNYINLDGSWYHVDITSNRLWVNDSYNSGDFPFFMLNDRELIEAAEGAYTSRNDWTTRGRPASTSTKFSS
ncbi:MAG: hypothetical protein FWD48_05935 [Oscillospiraceae bacterium]|nr:hypothetical protein [Oscillospiraceae bacterium]